MTSRVGGNMIEVFIPRRLKNPYKGGGGGGGVGSYCHTREDEDLTEEKSLWLFLHAWVQG